MKYIISLFIVVYSFFSSAESDSKESSVRTMQDCDQIALGGTFPVGTKIYEAKLKAEGFDRNGKAYAQYVVVLTTNKNATDDELFGLYKPKTKPKFISVVRTPTLEHLDSELRQDCENWVAEEVKPKVKPSAGAR